MNNLPGLFSSGLLGIAVALAILPVGYLQHRYRMLVVALLAQIVVLSVAGLPVVVYIRGISGDLSITTVVVLLLWIWWRTAGWRPPQHCRTTLYSLVLLCALIFYPMALGATAYDPYALGYGSLIFLALLAVVTLIAWWYRQWLLCCCITLALLAFAVEWYDSTNLWDYLIDPLVVMIALADRLKWLIGRLLTEAARE